MSDNRPPVYIEDDNLIIRASAIGHPCLWELIAAGQGEPMLPVPAALQRAFDEGNALEPVIIKRLEIQGDVQFYSHQSEGELWLSDNVAIRYHSDGLGNWRDTLHYREEAVVVEVKALSDALWQVAKRSSVGDVIAEYPWQLSSMMTGEGLPGLWVAYNKGLPPDADDKRQECADQGKILIEFVGTPPVSLTELQLKASLIKEGVYGESVTTSDRQCDSLDHWPCRYIHIRPQSETLTQSRTVLIPDNPDEYDRLVVEYLSFKGQADEAKARYESARDKLVEMAGDASYVQTDKFYIPIVEGTSIRTNFKAMSQDLRDAIDKYKTRKTYRYLKGIKRLGF